MSESCWRSGENEKTNRMGSCEEYSSSLPETPNQTHPESSSPGFNTDNTLLSNLYPVTGKEEEEEESLVEGLKHVTLEEDDWNRYGDNNNSSENLQVEWQNGENYQYPLNPYAEDCNFFLKTGNCKFGFNCKFNHPVGKGKGFQVLVSSFLLLGVLFSVKKWSFLWLLCIFLLWFFDCC